MQTPAARPASPAADRRLWAALALLAVLQLAAFWLLCQSQVRQAQMRHAGTASLHSAIESCVRRPGASTVVCAESARDSRLAGLAQGPAAGR